MDPDGPDLAPQNGIPVKDDLKSFTGFVEYLSIHSISLFDILAFIILVLLLAVIIKILITIISHLRQIELVSDPFDGTEHGYYDDVANHGLYADARTRPLYDNVADRRFYHGTYDYAMQHDEERDREPETNVNVNVQWSDVYVQPSNANIQFFNTTTKAFNANTPSFNVREHCLPSHSHSCEFCTRVSPENEGRGTPIVCHQRRNGTFTAKGRRFA